MENDPPTSLPETLPIRSNSKDSVSEEVPAEESVSEVVGVARSSPTSLTEDCSSSAEMQRLQAPLCPPLSSDIQIDSTVQKLQYGSQTDKEKRHSNSETNEIQPLAEGAGLVVIAGTKEKQSVSLEYKPETETNMELAEKEQRGENILPQPPSQICFTTSSPVPQSGVGFELQDSTEHGVVEQSDRDSLVHANQGSHIPPSGAAWQAGGHQDSKSSPLPVPSSDSSEIKQTDLSQTQPNIIKEISNDARESQTANSLESVETFEDVKVLVETSHRETQPPPAEILETTKARETLHGLYTFGNESSASSDTAGDIQRSCDRLEGEQVESSTREEQTDTSSSDFTTLPECSSTQESSPKPCAVPPLFDTGIVVSLQAGQVVETSHPSDQLTTTETSLVAELAEAQEIVVVREEAHISEEWSGMHLNQSYLLQREDGSVCEAAIVNELSTGEPKLYEERVQSDMELVSQPVEVYEFCGLVEEVAEETVCATSSAQMPHSPGYEVNLFNALLENSDEYTVKQDLELHLGPSIHTISESDTVIISQQPLPSSQDANEMQANNTSHNLSIQNTRVAAVGQHLVLDANQAVQVANSSEVCLVEVAAVTSDSFTVEETGASAQIVTTCSQVSAAVSDQTEVSDSFVIQTAPQKQEAEATAGSLSLISPVVTGEDIGMQLSDVVSVHVSHVEKQPSLIQTPGVTVVSATKPEACVSSLEGTKETPALTETPSQNIQNVAVPAETNPGAFRTTLSSSIINPKLLLLKPGETPPLKHPPSHLAQVSKQQNAAGKLANAHSSWPGTMSEECLPQTVSAADSLCASVALSSQKDQVQCSVSKNSVTAAVPVKVQQPTMSGNITPASVTPTSKSDKEALTVTKTSASEAVSQDVVAPTSATPPTTPDTLHVLTTLVEGDSATPTSPNNPISQPDSLYAEDESEDMEQDEPAGETEAQEVTSGQVSSPEEGSDEEPDADKTESEITTPSSSHKVRQWIADRVTVNSSPVSPSTSSSSYPGPSPISDWSTPRRERSSPLRGPHGKFVSPSSVGAYSLSSSPPDQTPQRSRGERHTDMAELAKHEADIEHRTQALKREGFWSMKRLTRLTEPPRPKVHWDYLCEEMQWLSADFAQERRWKRGVARKVVRMVMRHHEELRQKEEKAKRDEHAKIRRVASSIAKEVRAFWSSVEKVVQYKQQSRLEEKRKKALDLQLDFIVGQTEKYSDLLSKSLAPTRPAETVPVTPQKSLPPTADEDDRDFEPPCEEEDDEETIEVEEQQEGNDAESHRREIELLKEEGMLPLDQLLSTLKLPQDSGSEEECSDETSSSVEEEEEDGEFTANEEDAEDEEDTIAAQEKVEGNVDHAEELDDLAKEGDMSIEELLEKYKGAYASDYEAPSASGSKASSDSEVSGDEEEESEEDESDVESNTSSSDSPGDSAEDEDSEKEEEESEEEEDDDCGDEGMEVLLKEGDHSPPSSTSRPKKEISHIAATAESLQPKGYTLATTKVKTPIPFLLHGTLREYQHIGLDWLVTMYEKKLNGILADEMGLGKTIQTIALLAHLACEKGNWGPHLIIVPTSVMLNWEMELKRWCPGFKILTYFGSQKERKLKRQGWTKPNAFHVCITSYKLVLQDHQAFRRKSWRYLILDEAQNIKNFKSQRWQSLLNFNSHRRLLLTGTPLQNSLMELWSLMHFLMPHVFQSHREFKEWFSNPLTGMIEGSQEYNEGLVKRLHKVLRPFLLRRIKADVEKQMPKKYEHVVRCRLSKRQRFLYDDFMAQASTRETLASGHFMSVINILMQLRKVCNHPNLFDPRPIQSPFITQRIVFHTASLVQEALDVSPLKRCDLSLFNFVSLETRVSRYQADVFLPRHKVSRQLIQEIMESPEPPPRPKPVRMKVNRMFQPPPKGDNRPVLLMNKPTCSVPPAAQTPRPPPVTEVSATPAPAPVVQQVVCSVASNPPPRPSMHPAAQTAVRSSVPKPVLTVRPPTAPCTASIPAHASPSPSSVMPQRVLLSPDMQARLPSGEVVSIAQLASLAGRPVSSCQGSKPVTFQLQGNKLTLSGAQIHQVPAAPPRPVQGNVMHLVSSGVQHHLISQPAQVSVQSAANTHPANTSTAPPANRLPHNASSQVPSSMVSSPGVVKIVVRQSAGKEGGPVPTLAVAPSPRVAPQASPSLHAHANTTPVRNTAPLQISQRTPGPATAHYTIAPPRNPSSTQNQPQPPRPVLKVVQPPSSSTEQPAPATPSSSVSKASTAPRDSSSSSSSSQTPATTKSRPSAGAKAYPPPRKVPRPPPRSPFHMSWLAESHKQQHDSRLDFIIRVNEQHCGAKPVYGLEVLDFLTFLPSLRPSPAAQSSQGEWGRSGHSSCLFAQWQNKYDYWCQSHAVREAIHSIEERLGLLSDMIDRYTFVIPPVEAPPISMHCCHPPPSLSHKQTVFSSLLSTQVAPLTRSLHRIQCNMRTQFPDLRLIQYDCGKLQTLHTLLRKLKTGGHRVLIFTQMTRMLDVLEQFLNYHGHIYLRLDGSTRVEQRQALMERFNADRRIFCFILSTRSGGVGVNLTGADTVVFYDSDWNPTMDAQAQDRCHRIGQTRDVHIYRLISERTVEENILKKANQKRMLGDMAIEGGNFTTAFFKQQTIRELFDMNDGEKREMAVELSVPQAEEEEAVNKQSTTILEQALCRAEDEEDIVAASQAKAEQVAELAEFNENIPLDDGGEQEEVEELSKAEQEIAALVEQLTPIERYAMNFLEASLEDVCKEELKQAEEQVEAARKGLDQAKEEGLKLHASSDDDDDDFLSPPASVEPAQPAPARRGRKPKDKDKIVTSTRTSGRLRGASPETEAEPTTPREVPERPRLGLRGRGAAKDTGAVSTTPSRTDHQKTSSSTRLQDSTKSSKASSPARDHQTTKTRTLPNRSHPSPVPSPPSTSPPGGKQQGVMETDGKSSKAGREDKEAENERRISESSLESSGPADSQTKDDDSKDHSSMSPPSTSSRSPRKRQSADGEVLRGLVEDSPSAKVLRKLPGRLVTVVEEKEPRKRRRRGSGTGGGGSSEEATAEEAAAGFVDEPNKDITPPSPDSKTKETVTKPPQDQDSTPSPSVQPQPVRSYPPYSPPHLSPDMPVLRNLPVRRRLETESRMAAQLGEQHQHLGRGRGGNQSRKTDTLPGRDATSTSSESSVNSLVTPLKRKRGRPPKTPPRLPEPDNTATPSPQPTLPSEEGNPPLSPKRKRGRPRKDSTTTPDTVSEGQNSKKETATTDVSGLSKTDAGTEPASSETPTAAVISTGQASQSTTAEETDTKTEVSAPAPNPAQTSTPASASVQTPPAPAPHVTPPLPVAASTSASTQTVSSDPATVPISAATSTHISSASSSTLSTSATIPVTATTTPPPPPPPPVSTVSSSPPGEKPTLPPSTAPIEPKPSTSTAVKTTGSDTAKTTTVTTPVATAPPTTAVKAVPTSVPATIITAATTIVSKPVSVTPAVTTTVKPVTITKAIAAKDSPQASALSPSTSAPTTVSSAPVATSSSPATPSPKPSSTSSPTTAITTTTTTKTVQASSSNSAATMTTPAVKGVQTAPSSPTTVTTTTPVKMVQASSSNPTTTMTTAPLKPVQAGPLNSTSSSTVPTTSPATSGSASSTPPTKTAATSAANTAPSSPAQTRTHETSTNVPAKLVQTVQEAAQEKVAVKSPAVSPSPVCTPSPTTAPASFTTAAEAKVVAVTSSPPTGVVKATTPAAAAPSKEHTSTTAPPAPTAEKTVNITPPVTTATDAVATTTLTPEKSVTVDSTNTVATTQVSTITAAPEPVTTTTAAPPETTPQNSAPTGVSPEVSTPTHTEALPQILTSAPSSVSSEKLSTESKQKVSASKSDSDPVTEMEVDAVAAGGTSKEEDDKKQEICKCQPKRIKVESSSETQDLEPGRDGADGEAKTTTTPHKEEPKQQVPTVEEATEDQKPPKQKRPLSRQSSQESTRSSSPSSGGSTTTLTRHAHHRRTYENRHPAKRRRVDVTLEGDEEIKEEGGEIKEGGSKEDLTTSTSRRRHSRSSSSSSDSDNSESRKEHRLTRSAKRRLQDQEKEKGNSRPGKKPGHSTDRNASNNANASTGGESGSDTSSVRITRKSAGCQPSQDSKAQTNSAPSLPPEPEVLGKRCSALNAAAKLLAMKGRVDTPGHTTRKDSAAKSTGTSPASSSDKNQKPKNKSVPASPQSNSVTLTNSKSSGSKPSTPSQSSRSASRSTRQCPGSLVPPLEGEYKRCKPEEKDRGSRKLSRGKEGEAEAQSLSRGHSACSSMSSDGEGDGGGRSSRSRSSSNSSQRTHSISSQNTEHRESRSRGASSGSERERDRSSDRMKSRDKKEKQGQQRESRKESRRSQRLSQEVTSGSGTEGTPDRVLRSVAALAAVQARSPAASTRSSASQQRHNKT
ncbi:helicase SRCAP isoform X2 [Seriola aureovittata]|uniref:helicase SRCAP isoform X2 n=1 Tax=Seriola aureovittata TaxID=2871759 RepID=UPI0024BE7D06|nr:helicase SRCAP isoform X2 [Seriola aureovittata]